MDSLGKMGFSMHDGPLYRETFPFLEQVFLLVYPGLVSEVFKCMNVVIADGILVRVSPSHQHGAQCLTWAQGLAMLGCLGALVEGHLFACRDDYW
jgi:hypothetical protein